MHLDQNHWTTPKTITLDTLDEGAGGAARFITTVEMTGASPTDLPSAAVCRLACYYMLSRLNETSLVTACHSLADIYSWQIERARWPTPVPAEIRVVKSAPIMRRVQSRPFVISDD